MPPSGSARATTCSARRFSRASSSQPTRPPPSRCASTTSTRTSTSPNPSKPEPAIPQRWGRPLLLGSAAAGLLLAAPDAYVVVTLLPAMLYALDLSVDRIEQATPIVSGFLAGYIVVMPLLGLASDLHGRAAVYLGALAIFAAGSVLTATAGYQGEAPGRARQGLGGGATVPFALALSADLFPAGRRTAAIGAVAAVQETGSVLGPLYGAGLAAAAANLGGWRAVFWLNVPLAALCAAGFLIASRQTRIGAAPR